MRVLVTGGAGFIGSHLVDALIERGDQVHVLDNLSTGKPSNVHKDARLHVGDVRRPEIVFDLVRPEAVYHLAAQADIRKSILNPFVDADINFTGTLRVLEASRRHEAKIVFASTGGAIYGETEEPARELDQPRPLSPYGTAKLASEEYLRTWGRLYGTEHVSLRFANVYGPRQDPYGEAGVVAIFMGAHKAAITPIIYGDGTQERDYVYVTDVTDALIAAHDKSVSDTYNVSTGYATTVATLHTMISDTTGNTSPPVHKDARLGDLHRGVLNPSLARTELAWQPRHTLAEGLQATWESLR